MRRAFHRQLKHLWSVNSFLKDYREHPDGGISHRPPSESGAYWDHPENQKMLLSEILAEKHKRFGYKFVPLVRDEISLLCSLNILFLRRDIPGSVLQAGDIDNRIKTLIDGLRAPNSPNELAEADRHPRSDEYPFFCLLLDDKQVSHFSVETDTLLDPPMSDDTESKKVRIIITVELKPYNVSFFNLNFAGG